jgi:hypothetical protein
MKATVALAMLSGYVGAQGSNSNYSSAIACGTLIQLCHQCFLCIQHNHPRCCCCCRLRASPAPQWCALLGCLS